MQPAEGIHGRGAQSQPANPYLKIITEADYEDLEAAGPEINAELFDAIAKPKTEYMEDSSQSIISENRSPDIPFRYSLNPYRGCSHGCSYCYARPTHEYLGMSAGLDFETKIVCKPHAAELFQKWLARSKYEPAVVMLSGVTDCYQPIERKKRITRRCLEVAARCRQPVGVITKNALVARDLDLLAELARYDCASVAISLTTLDADLARRMEPRTSSPVARLRTITELTEAGISVHAMLAPLVPGLNDSEAPALLAAAREAGAESASHILLRLPATVRPVFLEWLEKSEPNRRNRVETLLRSTRDGKLNDSLFGTRMRGTGPYADQLNAGVEVLRKKLGLMARPRQLRIDQFQPPEIAGDQRWLF